MPGATTSRKEFLEYVCAFNAHDFDKYYSFYYDDVTLDIPDPQTGMLYGKESIRRHYLPLFEEADEVIVPMVVAVEGYNIFYIMELYFRYRVQNDKGVFVYSVTPGDIVKIRVWAHYVVENVIPALIFCRCIC
ncbi:hypothetical protein Sste5346_003909 [Sporothrix stenoceras]|uniref:SnoaL-like domain-containing protein n=1 Tax=Sporothrix stenoceras TaxID=5173 RepID=A0ABR3ZAH9_9PEZI